MFAEPRAFTDVPWFWSDQYDLKLQIAGLALDYDTTVMRGDTRQRKFAVYYMHGKRLVAVDAINSPKDFILAKRLLSANAEPSPEAIADLEQDLLIQVHPTSDWLFKCWRDEYMAEIIDYLSEKHAAKVVITGSATKKELDKIVEKSLKDAALWNEVGERLGDSAMGLSGGQQQRLCIARTLSIEPEVILMDEPCSALDPIATGKIEDLIDELKKKYTVIIVTHNMQQAARVSDYTGFFYLGKLIEYGETKQIFENPREELTENYMTGRFG